MTWHAMDDSALLQSVALRLVAGFPDFLCAWVRSFIWNIRSDHTYSKKEGPPAAKSRLDIFTACVARTDVAINDLPHLAKLLLTTKNYGVGGLSPYLKEHLRKEHVAVVFRILLKHRRASLDVPDWHVHYLKMALVLQPNTKVANLIMADVGKESHADVLHKAHRNEEGLMKALSSRDAESNLVWLARQQVLDLGRLGTTPERLMQRLLTHHRLSPKIYCDLVKRLHLPVSLDMCTPCRWSELPCSILETFLKAIIIKADNTGVEDFMQKMLGVLITKWDVHKIEFLLAPERGIPATVSTDTVVQVALCRRDLQKDVRVLPPLVKRLPPGEQETGPSWALAAVLEQLREKKITKTRAQLIEEVLLELGAVNDSR